MSTLRPRETTKFLGFTLTETMFAMLIVGIVSVAILAMLRNGVILYAKNEGVNIAHQQARQALDRLTRDIHDAMSIPALVDANRNAVTGVGPAEGVSFLRQTGPTCIVAADVAANQNVVQLTGLGTYSPTVGQRLVIPAMQVEADITAVSGSSLTLATNVGVPIKTTVNGNSANIVAYIADIITYVVVNGQLRLYQNASTTDYTVLARSMTNPKPFGAPFYAQQ